MNTSIENKSNKKIFIGTLLGYVSFFLAILSGLILTPWIISNIGDSQYGIYTLCFSIIGIFMFDFGLSLTTNSYLSKLKAQNDTKGIQKFTSVVFKIYLIIDIVIFLIFLIAYLLIDVVYVGMTQVERDQLKICFIIVGIFSLISFPSTVFTGSLYSNEKFILLRLIDIINKIAMMVMTIIFIECNMGVYGLVLSYSLAGLISIFIRVVWFKFCYKGKLFTKEKADKEYIMGIVKFSIWAALLSFAFRFVFNIAPSILGIVSNSTEIAIFGIIVTIENYIYLFGSMCSSLFMPKTFRGLEEDLSSRAIEERAIKTGKILSFMISMIIFGFLSCGKEFIAFWMKGDTYAPAYLGIAIVSLYELINIPEIVYYDSMMFKGHIKPLAIISLVKAAVNLGLSFLLGYYYGAIGICIAVCITRLLEQFAYNIAYKKCLGVSFVKLFTNSIFPSVLTGFMTFVLVIGINKCLSIDNPVILFLINGFTFIIIYAFVTYLTNKDYFIMLLKKLRIKS